MYIELAVSGNILHSLEVSLTDYCHVDRARACLNFARTQLYSLLDCLQTLCILQIDVSGGFYQNQRTANFRFDKGPAVRSPGKINQKYFSYNVVKGVVTIRSEIFNQLKKIIYKCLKCGFLKGPFYINNINDIRLGSCSSCQSTGPFPIDKQKTIYRNYQKLILQESPSEVLPGRIPRSK